MNEKNLFLRPIDEDVDFLPIIPFNEAEAEDEEIDIPSELPILPLRNTVLFPGVVLPITVGRDINFFIFSFGLVERDDGQKINIFINWSQE